MGKTGSRLDNQPTKEKKAKREKHEEFYDAMPSTVIECQYYLFFSAIRLYGFKTRKKKVEQRKRSEEERKRRKSPSQQITQYSINQTQKAEEEGKERQALRHKKKPDFEMSCISRHETGLKWRREKKFFNL